jgi:hypothetical protein
MYARPCQVGDPQGLLFLAAGTDHEDVLVVVIPHPGHVIGATATPAFTEWRMVEVERVGPREQSPSTRPMGPASLETSSTWR